MKNNVDDYKNTLNLHYNYDGKYHHLLKEIEELKEENNGLMRNFDSIIVNTFIIKKNKNDLEDKLISANRGYNDKFTRFKEYILLFNFSKIEFFEEENEKFRNEKTKLFNNTNEKITLLTKLCKNYIKKFKKLSLFLMQSDPNPKEKNENIINELNSTIERFWSTLHNPSIIKPLLDIDKSIDYNVKQIIEDEINSTKFIKINLGILILTKEILKS